MKILYWEEAMDDVQPEIKSRETDVLIIGAGPAALQALKYIRSLK